MGVRTGQASVDVVADVDGFAAEFGKDLNNTLDKVKVDGRKIGQKLADDVDAGVKKAEQSIKRLDSVDVGGKIAAGADEAKKALGEVGDAAEQGAKETAAAGKKAGDGLADGVGEGADRAKESLGDIPDKARESADRTQQGFSKLSAGLAAVGLAAGAALTAGITEGIQQSKLNAVLAAQIGASPAEAARVGKISGQVYASGFGADVGEVNTALKNVFQNGLADVGKQTDEAVSQVTKRLLTVSTVLEEESGRTAIAIQNLIRNGLVKNSEEAMDLLVVATQKGVNKSEDLLDTVNEYSTQFRQLGLSGPQAMGLLSQAIQAGARDSDTAADAIKEFAIRAIDGSEASAKGYEILGLNAKDFTEIIAKGGDVANEAMGTVLDRLREVTDPVQRNAAAVALFGTKAEDLGESLFAMDLDTAAAQMGNFAGAVDTAGNTIQQSAGAKLEAFTRMLKGELITVLGAVAGHMMANKEVYIAVAAAIGIMAVAIGVVTAATKLWALATAMTPLGWLAIAIAAIVGAFTLAYQKSETFRTIVQTSLRAVGDAAIWLWENAIKPAFNGIVAAGKAVGTAAVWLWQTVLQPAFTAIGTAAVWLWQNALLPAFNGIVAAVKFVGSAVSWLWSTIIQPYFQFIGTIAMWLWTTIIQPTWNQIVTATRILGNIFAWLYSVFSPPMKAIASLVFWIWKSVFLIAWAGIKAAFETLAGVVKWWWNTVLSPTFKAVATAVKWLWSTIIVPAFNGMKAAFMVVANAARAVWVTYISPMIKNFQNGVRTLYNSYVLPIFNAIRSHIVGRIQAAVAIISAIRNFVSNASASFTNMVNAVRSRMDSVVSTIRGLPGRIKSALGNLGSLLYNAGRNVIQGLINGISSKLQSLRNIASNAASTIRNLFPFSPAKEGPLSGSGSPDIAGGKIAEMVAQGMERNTPRLYEAARAMAAATMGGRGGGLDFAGQGIMRSALGSRGTGAVTPPAGGGTTIVFSDGAIRITFQGPPPTEAQAYRTGQAVGAGIASTLTSRAVHNTVRTL